MRYALRVDANQAEVVAALVAAGARVDIIGNPVVNSGHFGPHTDYKAMASRRRSFDGANNPNFKDAEKKVCTQCEKPFNSYIKTRKYCCVGCYSVARTKPIIDAPEVKQPKTVTKKVKPPPKIRGLRTVEKTCFHCGKLFLSHMSANRVYCSYKCHLDNGGSLRAGVAAIKARMKYGAKKDANHNEVVEALEKNGVLVIDMSSAGGGFPDLICGYAGLICLVEIKNLKTGYGRRGLNKTQKKWHARWEGFPIFMVDSAECAMRHMRVLAYGVQKT